MALPIIEPFSRALNTTGRSLFTNFSAGKWFTMAFCAWLSTFATTDTNVGNAFRWPGGGGGTGGMSTSTLIGLIVGIAIVALLVWIVLTFVGARGRMMFIDNVSLNRGAVRAPWREYRREGNSLFRLLVAFSLLAFVLIVVIIAGALGIAWTDIQRDEWGVAATVALVLGIGLLLPAIIGTLVLRFVIHEFVTPVMYLYRVDWREAVTIVRRELIRPHLGSCVLYGLFRFLLDLVIGMMVMVLTIATCCATALPYVNAVILLPILFFSQAYSLHFLEGVHPDWRFFADTRETPPNCPVCGFSRNTLAPDQRCPECGHHPVTLEPPPPDAPPTDPGGRVDEL